jgi:RecJ-like exonuclease
MEGLLSPPCKKELEAARDLFLEEQSRWRVIYHNDGDGVASAAVLANAMVRLQKPFQMTPFTDVDTDRMKILMRETHGPLLVVDTGSSMLPQLSQHEFPVIVLDHHVPPDNSIPDLKKFRFANPHDWGVDGMVELSASMLSFLFALHLDSKNSDLIAWGLSGAIADRQHVGGFRGLNLALLREAEKSGEVVPERSLSIFGPTLEEAIASSIDPYLAGLTGRHQAVRAMLAGLSLDGLRPVDSLSNEEKEKLSGAMLARLIAQGARPEFCVRVAEDRYRVPRLKSDAATLSLLQNATARENESSIGVALALGDAKAMTRAWELEKKWRGGIIQNLNALETGIERKESLQWFRATEAALGGTVAGLALNYFLDPTKPVFAMAPRGKAIKVSARGTHWLVEKGLDLNKACRAGASTVKGEGGGHRVASGATIPPGTEEQFLDAAAAVIGEQLRSLRGQG